MLPEEERLSKEAIRERIPYLLDIHPSRVILDKGLLGEYRKMVTDELVDLLHALPAEITKLMFLYGIRIAVGNDSDYIGLTKGKAQRKTMWDRNATGMFGYYDQQGNFALQARLRANVSNLYGHGSKPSELTISEKERNYFRGVMLHEMGHKLDFILPLNARLSSMDRDASFLYWRDLFTSLHAEGVEAEHFKCDMEDRIEAAKTTAKYKTNALYEGAEEARKISNDMYERKTPIIWTATKGYDINAGLDDGEEKKTEAQIEKEHKDRIETVQTEGAAEILRHYLTLTCFSDLSYSEIDRRLQAYAPEAWDWAKEAILMELEYAEPPLAKVETLRGRLEDFAISELQKDTGKMSRAQRDKFIGSIKDAKPQEISKRLSKHFCAMAEDHHLERGVLTLADRVLESMGKEKGTGASR